MKNIINKLIMSLMTISVLALISNCGEDVPNLNAVVKCDGKQFTITNKDDYDWNDCKVEVNSGYSMRGKKFSAGETYTVGLMQFVDKNGKRFNPFTHKVESIYLSCKNEDGQSTYNMYKWD